MTPATRCAECGRDMRAGAHFCHGCGAGVQGAAGTSYTQRVGPTAPMVGPPSRGPRLAHAPTKFRHGFALFLIFVCLAILATVWFVLPKSTTPSPAPPPPAAVPTTTSALPSEGGLLTDEAAADRTRVASALGRWVPQISSKRLGTVANGIVYDESSIWAEFQQNRSRYPDAVLLRSDDYGTFRIGGYWVTVVDIAYDDAASANAWCESQGLDADHCFAKRIGTSPGPGPDTVHRN
jgi:hypothetical protein